MADSTGGLDPNSTGGNSNLFNPGISFFPGERNYNPNSGWAPLMPGGPTYGPRNQNWYDYTDPLNQSPNLTTQQYTALSLHPELMNANPTVLQQQHLANIRDLPTTQQTGQFDYNPQDLQNDPGYQFQLQQGMQAVQQNALASGGFFTGQTGVNLNNMAQGLANTTYNQAYQRALQRSQQNQSINQQNFGQDLSVFDAGERERMNIASIYNQNFTQGEQERMDMANVLNQNFNQGEAERMNLYNLYANNQNQEYNLRNNAMLGQIGLFQNANQNVFNNNFALAQLGLGASSPVIGQPTTIPNYGVAGNIYGNNATTTGINQIRSALPTGTSPQTTDFTIPQNMNNGSNLTSTNAPNMEDVRYANPYGVNRFSYGLEG